MLGTPRGVEASRLDVVFVLPDEILRCHTLRTECGEPANDRAADPRIEAVTPAMPPAPRAGGHPPLSSAEGP